MIKTSVRLAESRAAVPTLLEGETNGSLGQGRFCGLAFRLQRRGSQPENTLPGESSLRLWGKALSEQSQREKRRNRRPDKIFVALQTRFKAVAGWRRKWDVQAQGRGWV